MTLDGLLALGAILVAIVAIADPVQRRSILLFIPRTLLFAALGASVLVVVFLRAAEVWNVATPPWARFVLYSGSFSVPVLAVVACILSWHRANLTKRKVDGFRDVVHAALRQGTYDELERILRKNEQQLHVLPLAVLHSLFDRKVVRALLDARSYLHIELLADPQILDSVDRSCLLFVDNVVRELVSAPNSPWRSAVLSANGGHDSWAYLDEEREMVERTLENPAWYVDASAHGPLVMTAIETIQSGRLDIDYNQIGRAYESREGISSRANCPVFLAAKMEVLAIRAAVRQRHDADFYVTDLWSVFRTVRDHSTYNEVVWESPLANPEFPTPYAYLLHEIFYNLRSLVWDGLSTSVERPQSLDAEQLKAVMKLAEAESHGQDSGPQSARRQENELRIRAPASIDRQSAQVWSFCAWEMARAKGKVGEDFRIGMIREYLDLVLQLHCQSSEILRLSSRVVGLEPWRDLFLDEIRQRFGGSPSAEYHALERAFSGLDSGKTYVLNGRDWLGKELGIKGGDT